MPDISRGKAELSAVPGILTPGQIIKITHDDPALDNAALVLANRIAAQGAGAAAVYQSVTLERIA